MAMDPELKRLIDLRKECRARIEEALKSGTTQGNWDEGLSIMGISLGQLETEEKTLDMKIKQRIGDLGGRSLMGIRIKHESKEKINGS